MRILILIAVSFLIGSCSVGPEEINYGHAACHFCKMTIVDNQHAAEIVSTKGKVFQYDAIECMITDFDEKATKGIGMVLINDYAQPGALVDATSATYLISDKIKSPMGANLSGFQAREKAQQMLDENGGTLFSWEEIQKEIQ